jgi:AmmeMemoRadiSam system protein B
MTFEADMRPKLRALEAHPAPEGSRGLITLCDAAGLSPVALTVSEPVVFVLDYFDGEHTLGEISAAFGRQFRQALAPETLATIVSHLREAYFLDDESFEAYYQGLVKEYRAAPARTMRSAGELGIDPDIGRWFEIVLAGEAGADGEMPAAGLIAPHLDYPRGAPCYAAAYARLRNRPVPGRVIVLGTNHFGRSTAVVTTGKDFATPLGTTRTDVAFIEQLEGRCGDLRRFEFDHQREHSVELQVLWCQHLFGPERFTLVPILCPDPCGPTGTAPSDGQGVDLRDFARALSECIPLDNRDTLLIAGADLSHVGARFGDRRKLDDAFLPEVRRRDQEVLQALERDGAEAFLTCVAEGGNPTRICSAGCIFTLLTALPGAKARLLKYHQAVHEESQTGVSCAAVVVTK